MLSELNYKHIIKYYGSFAESGFFYIVMEYATEGSLADMIDVWYLLNIIYMVMNLYIRSEKN